MNDKILSVIVPLYNKEKLIEQCLNSFTRTEFEDMLEVIVIDDGSNDHSYDRALEYEKQYPNIFRVIHKENGGVGSVVNMGLQLAQGKYVKEVDADDWVDANALMNLLVFLEKNDVDIVLNPMREVDAEGRLIKENYFKGVYFGKIYEIDELVKRAPFTIQRMTIRKEILDNNQVKLHETRYYIDMQLVGESVLYASTCAILSDSLYRYRKEQEEQSVSLNSYIKHRDDFYKQTVLSAQRADLAKDKGLKENRISYFMNKFKIFSLYLYGIYLASSEENTEWRQFDTWLQAECAITYESLSTYECVSCVRGVDKQGYGAQRNYFLDKWRDYAEQNHKVMELYDVAHIKAGLTDLQQNSNVDKCRLLYGLQEQWMMNRDQGMRIENYFVKNDFSNIAIYGMGSLGNHLYAELENSDRVQVKYAIDRKGTSIFRNLTVKQPMEDLNKVDVIVVTLVAEYDEVMSLLREKVSCPVVLIEEVICES